MAEQPRAPRNGRVVRAGLVVATLGVGVGLAAIPVGNWMEQRDELDDARTRRAELQTEVAEIQTEILGMVGPEALEAAARCYGLLVEVGEEVYAVPGLEGCVTTSTP